MALQTGWIAKKVHIRLLYFSSPAGLQEAVPIYAVENILSEGSY